MNAMRRALLLAGLGMATCLHAAAPPGKTWRLGILVNESESSAQEVRRIFIDALRREGYVEGRNLVLEWRYSDARTDRLGALARELAEKKVDLIVSNGTPATQAAQKATLQIPIVAVTITDPERMGMAKTLAKPGFNVTGVSNLGPDTVAKRLELLRLLVPQMRRVAYVYNPDNPGNVLGLVQFAAATKAMGLEQLEIPARNADELRRQLSTLSRDKVDVLGVSQDGVLSRDIKAIADAALAARLPSVSGMPAFVPAGGLCSYIYSAKEQWTVAIGYIDRILNGAKAGDLPFAQPTQFDIGINRSTAKALGIAIPQDLLLRATLLVD